MNNPELTVTILNWIQMLRNRPGQILLTSQPTYEQLHYYVYAYLDGIGCAVGRSLHANFHNWTAQQQKLLVPCVWGRYLQMTHKEASEEELIKLFLNDMETYFKQNPNWQEDEDIPLRIWFDGENE